MRRKVNASTAGFFMVRSLACATVVPIAMAPAAAQVTTNKPDLTDQVPPGATIANYSGTEVMIPMRDGTRLHAQVWRPKRIAGPVPILMSRSPYGVSIGTVTNLLTRTQNYSQPEGDRRCKGHG